MVNENLPSLEPVVDIDDSDEDFSEDEFNQSNEEEIKCLFCKESSFKDFKGFFKHLELSHDFHLQILQEKFHMDHYSFIKMVNYIRVNNAKVEDIKNANATNPLWSDDKYLKPKEYDPLLCFDFEELSEPKSSQQESPEEVIGSLLAEIKHKNDLLEQAYKDIEKMKASFKRLVEEDSSEPEHKVKSISSISLKADQGYFNSYDHYGIHLEMLSDHIRTDSYRKAFLENSDFIKNKDILDVGCGTSILSMFASKAGANQVVAVDNSDIIYNAMDIVKKNCISNITFVKGRLEDTELPIEKFDIIVSEWMGYFLFFEGMLDSIIYARDNHLKDGGTLLPNRCNISLVGFCDVEFHKKYVKFWSDVYGFNMTSMVKEILREPIIEVLNPNHALTNPVIIVEYDLNTVDTSYSNFAFKFNLKCIKDGLLTGFASYFDIFFDLDKPIMFSTSPKETPTHWKQVVFLLDEPVFLKDSDIIEGKIECRRSKNCLRSLDICISVFNKEFKYFLD